MIETKSTSGVDILICITGHKLIIGREKISYFLLPVSTGCPENTPIVEKALVDKRSCFLHCSHHKLVLLGHLLM